jgi:hypothetical protein
MKALLTNRATVIGAALLFAIALTVGWFYHWGSEQTLTCTVTDKDRTTTTDAEGNTKSIHRVYTDECGVLEVNDVLLRGNFNSADDYAVLKEGETYELTTIGWRIPLLSQFPTVIDVESTR